MTRLQRLHNLKKHPMLGKDFKRLNKAQLAEIELFITERDHMTDDQFMHDANRFQIDKCERDMRISSIQWSLLTQAVDTVANLKKRGAK